MGLAIAIIFTWKILRAPGGYQRRQRRQHRHLPRAGVSGVSPQSSPVMPSTGLFSYSDESKAQDVIDELFHPGKVFVVFGSLIKPLLLLEQIFTFSPCFAADAGAISKTKVERGKEGIVAPLELFRLFPFYCCCHCRSSISCNTDVMVPVLYFFQFLLRPLPS